MKHSGRSGNAAPRSGNVPFRRAPSEDADYTGGTPEKEHLRSGVGGEMPHGNQVNGSYSQPWVHHDGVIDPNGDSQEG